MTTAHLHESSPLLWKLLSSRLFVSYLELQIWSPLSAFSFGLKTQCQFDLFGQDFVFIKGLWLQNWWGFFYSLIYLNRRDKLVSKWRQWRRVLDETRSPGLTTDCWAALWWMPCLFVDRWWPVLLDAPQFSWWMIHNDNHDVVGCFGPAARAAADVNQIRLFVCVCNFHQCHIFCSAYFSSETSLLSSFFFLSFSVIAKDERVST